jgi:hypothetical protein
VTLEEAREHAERWVDAWNRHDVDAVLAMYADEVVLRSPLASTWDPSNAEGAIRGKTLLHGYFEAALQRFPELQLELLDVYVASDDRLVVEYLNRPNTERELYVLERTHLADGVALDVEAAYGLERRMG